MCRAGLVAQIRLPESHRRQLAPIQLIGPNGRPIHLQECRAHPLAQQTGQAQGDDLTAPDECGRVEQQTVAVNRPGFSGDSFA